MGGAAVMRFINRKSTNQTKALSAAVLSWASHSSLEQE
jgi:hypothetical protein